MEKEGGAFKSCVSEAGNKTTNKPYPFSSFTHFYCLQLEGIIWGKKCLFSFSSWWLRTPAVLLVVVPAMIECLSSERKERTLCWVSM